MLLEHNMDIKDEEIKFYLAFDKINTIKEIIYFRKIEEYKKAIFDVITEYEINRHAILSNIYKQSYIPEEAAPENNP